MIPLVLLLLCLGVALWLLDGRLSREDGEALVLIALLWVALQAERRTWR